MLDPRTFGRYENLRKLARGGMGRVYLAFDPVLGREVVLKLIDSGTDAESVEILAAERRGAMLQDQLAQRDPGGRVAQIYDVGEGEGYFYIAMEYIEGEDLSELVSRGPIAPERAVGIALDILEVLATAHTFQAVIEERQHRGIIHGDIKPRNVRLTPSGQVKLLDFGIAKAVSMTRSLTFNQFGSVPYSSPERLQTGDMDARSDIWSVGVVLFEMVAGKAYFQAESAQKLEWMIRNYSAPQPALEQVPGGLRSVLARALHPDAGQRFSSAGDMRAALAAWQGGDTETIDMEATRRTIRQVDDVTRRTVAAPAMSPKPAAAAVMATAPASKPSRFRLGMLAAGALLFVFSAWATVSEIRQWGKAGDLRRRLESGQIATPAAAEEYQTLAKSTWFSWPLSRTRNSLRDRYAAEADRVIADYREAGESTPVYTKDWKRAQASIAAAAAFAPDDLTVRGRASLIDGHLKLRAGDVKGARASFEAARGALSRSPDPHLGLAMIYLMDSDLDKAQEQFNEAQRTGFRPGRREQKSLADAYRRRGARWITVAKKARDITHMSDAYKKADADLEQAQSLYTSIAPYYDGIELAERVALDREQVQKLIAAAQLAQAPAGTP